MNSADVDIVHEIVPGKAAAQNPNCLFPQSIVSELTERVASVAYAIGVVPSYTNNSLPSI